MTGPGQKYRSSPLVIDCAKFRAQADAYMQQNQIGKNDMAKLIGGRHKLAGDFAPLFYDRGAATVKTRYGARIVELLGAEVLAEPSRNGL